MRLILISRMFLLLTTVLTLQFDAVAQRAKPKTKTGANTHQLSLEAQDALDTLRSVARDLKSEADRISAARLQARVADELWLLDEPFARESFRWSWETVRQSPSEQISKVNLARQASAMKEVLRRFGARDAKAAQEWLRAFEEDELSKISKAGTNVPRPDLLMAIALQLATADPGQALQLGVISLSGNELPEGFSQLLFALGNIDRKLSDQLFRAGIAALRRTGYQNSMVPIALSNYLFSSAGDLYSDSTNADAQLLANYFVDSAWQQTGNEGAPVSASGARMYALLEVRGVPIVSRYAPGRLPELRGQMTRLAAGLNAEQARNVEMLRSVQSQQNTISTRNNYDIDEQIERALKERDLGVRDALLNSIAHSLMREDGERALTVASKIDDTVLRSTVEDDINLVRIQQHLYAKRHDEAQKLSLKLNNATFRATVVVQLAAKIFSDTKDLTRFTELLSEANKITTPASDTADKVIILLEIARQFAVFDSVRAFNTLEIAISTLNRLKVDKEGPTSILERPQQLRIKTYTVINGTELTTGSEATPESIDFAQIEPLVARDYMQSRLLAAKIEKPLQRANFLTAVAASCLKAEKERRVALSATH